MSDDKELPGAKVIIKTGEGIELSKLRISITEVVGSNPVNIMLFDQGILNEKHLPQSAGIYRLTILYNEIMIYREVLFYPEDPGEERLNFYFYYEENKLLCLIQSLKAAEINKIIMLNEYSGGWDILLSSLN